MWSSGAQWRPLVGTIAGVFLGVVLLVAAWGKAMSPGAFLEQIRLEGLDFLFSASTTALLGLALEAGLGLALLLGVRRPWVLAAASLLVAFFVFLNGRNYYLVLKGLRDETASCGCFGELLDRTPAAAFWQDLFLLLPPLALSLWGRPRESRPIPKVRLALALSAAIAISLFAWSNPDLHYAEAAAEISEGAGGGSFLRSRDYLLLVDGQEVPEAEIYHSRDPVAFLILAPQLSSPVLLEPLGGVVEELQAAEVIRRDDGSIELLRQSGSRPSAPFEVLPEGIRFGLAGHEVEMRDKVADN